MRTSDWVEEHGCGSPGEISPRAVRTLRTVTNQVCDIIFHETAGKLQVASGDLRPIAGDPNLARLICILEDLGFKLPNPTFPVHFATWATSANGWTLFYGLPPKKRATFLDKDQFGAVVYSSASTLAVTLWHEVKGHNIDGADDGPAFDTKYEVPLVAAISKLMADKRYENNNCAECFDGKGHSWLMKTAWDEVLCRCGVPKRKP